MSITNDSTPYECFNIIKDSEEHDGCSEFPTILFMHWKQAVNEFIMEHKSFDQYIYTLDGCHEYLDENSCWNRGEDDVDMIQPSQIRYVCNARNIIEAAYILCKKVFETEGDFCIFDYYCEIFESKHYGKKCNKKTSWYDFIIKLTKDFSEQFNYYDKTTYITKINFI